MNSPIRILALIALVVLSTLGGAPANAHSDLTGSDPADGSTLQQLPDEATFDFTGLLQEPAYVSFTPPGEKAQPLEGVVIDGPSITVPLPEGGDGIYNLAFRVISEDGHPISGAIRFGVGAETTPTSVTPAAAAEDADTGSALIGLLAALGVIVAGTVGLLLWRRRGA